MELRGHLASRRSRLDIVDAVRRSRNGEIARASLVAYSRSELCLFSVTGMHAYAATGLPSSANTTRARDAA